MAISPEVWMDLATGVVAGWVVIVFHKPWEELTEMVHEKVQRNQRYSQIIVEAAMGLLGFALLMLILLSIR